jgi:Flp pilus assembly protein TadD
MAAQSSALDETDGRRMFVSADFLKRPLSGKARKKMNVAIRALDNHQYESATILLKETLKRHPETEAHVHTALAFALIRMERFEEALPSLHRAVLLLPHDAFNRFNLAVALAGSGRFDAALAEARRAQEMAPHSLLARRLIDQIEKDLIRTH